eukprot:6438578-Amphidinium_carterae.1
MIETSALLKEAQEAKKLRKPTRLNSKEKTSLEGAQVLLVESCSAATEVRFLICADCTTECEAC